MKHLLCIILAFCLIGCASSGRKIDHAKVSDIKKGTTTEAELLNWFGKPNSTSITPEGKVLVWTHAQAHALPFYAQVQSDSLMVRLDDQGTVSTFQQTDAQNTSTVFGTK
tara:strand:+ start:860 stop:1189 length:330 start_codon:yes stop_codon:yes gene_type:complete